MRYLTSTLAALALAGAAGVFAQEQQPAQPPAQEQQPPAQEQTPKSTLTGCVVQAKTTDGGTVYVLTKAEGGTATMYVLAGRSDTEMSGNLNKKIEVTGPVQEAPAADGPPDPNVVRPPAVIAETVRVVSETCT